LGYYTGVIIIVMISFWFFYGRQLFLYLGLDKTGRFIDQLIAQVINLTEIAQKKIVMFFLYSCYFFILLYYLNLLIPYLRNILGDDFILIGICFSIFLFYYGAP